MAELVVEANGHAEEKAPEPESAKLYFVRMPRPPMDDTLLKRLQADFQAHIAEIKGINTRLAAKRVRRTIGESSGKRRGIFASGAWPSSMSWQQLGRRGASQHCPTRIALGHANKISCFHHCCIAAGASAVLPMSPSHSRMAFCRLRMAFCRLRPGRCAPAAQSDAGGQEPQGRQPAGVRGEG